MGLIKTPPPGKDDVEEAVARYGAEMYGLAVAITGNVHDAEDAYESAWSNALGHWEQLRDISKRRWHIHHSIDLFWECTGLPDNHDIREPVSARRVRAVACPRKREQCSGLRGGLDQCSAHSPANTRTQTRDAAEETSVTGGRAIRHCPCPWRVALDERLSQ
jgi:hypothetical protein